MPSEDKQIKRAEYHKEFYERHSEEKYSELIIKPKLEKIREKYSKLLKS